MSLAREEFLRNIVGIGEAVNIESLAQGAVNAVLSPGILVLRKGVLVASLVALETFIRDRTAEALEGLERWPRSFEDLPDRLRMAARLDSLLYLQNFAKMLKRQGDDFELELRQEIERMSSGHGTVQRFTKFVAGDYTGNLSNDGLRDLLKSLQIRDCWSTFRIFSSEIGFGVPSVEEVLKDIVRKRHRSAHSARFSPNATDISDLSRELLCIGMCFDASVSASMAQAIAFSEKWASGDFDWRSAVNLYFIERTATKVRLKKHGRMRAICVVNDAAAAKLRVPASPLGQISVLAYRDSSGRPESWDIL